MSVRSKCMIRSWANQKLDTQQFADAGHTQTEHNLTAL